MREQIKVAKAEWKESLKNKELYKRKRDELLSQFAEADIPLWGNVKFVVTKL